MDNASNKGLYTLIAVVVFGIFLSLSYFLFQDQMKGVIATVLDKTSQSVDRKLYSNLESTSPYFFGTVITAQGTLTITSYDTSGGLAIIIPSEINGIPVTAIATDAFKNKGLTSVEIPNSVTSIGYAAFLNNQLTSVVIPNSVTSIGNSAFYNNKLTSVEIPNSVTSIGNSAFYNNKLTSVVIPNSVTSIGNSAFYNNKLTSVEIPNSVTSIGNSAFYNNPLTSARVPTSTVIQANTFPAATVITRY